MVRDSWRGLEELRDPDPYADLRRAIRRQVRNAISEARFQASVAAFAETVRTARRQQAPRLIEADATIPKPVIRWVEQFARQLGIAHPVTVRLDSGMRREGVIGAHIGGAGSFDGRSLIIIDQARLTENDRVSDRRTSVTVPGLLESLSHELCHARFPKWSERKVQEAVRQYWVNGIVPYSPQ